MCERMHLYMNETDPATRREPDASPGLSRPPLFRRRQIVPALALAGLMMAGLARFESALPLLSGPADDINAEEAHRLQEAFARMPPVGLSPVPRSEIGHAVQAMELSDPERASMVADLDSGRQRLAWISLYDSHTEDGDVVTVRSEGYSRTVLLRKQPTRIAIPIPASRAVDLTGAVDGGGGGVTVGVMTSSGPLALPPMAVGQTIRLPVGTP
jgi:hypothetical protein